MKIISFTVYLLPNGTHADFYFTLLEQAQACEAIVTNLGAELATLETAYNAEATIMRRVRKNAMTEKISQQDGVRDRLYSLLYFVVKTSRDLPGEGLKEAAQKLFVVLRQFGNLPAMQYDRETGMMRVLCEELQRFYEAEVERLNLTETVENLRVANETFSNLLRERNDEVKGFLKNEMAAARKNTDAAYYQLVELINSLSTLETHRRGADQNPYRPFVEWLNAYIDRLKQEALKQRVRNESAEPTDEQSAQ